MMIVMGTHACMLADCPPALVPVTWNIFSANMEGKKHIHKEFLGSPECVTCYYEGKTPFLFQSLTGAFDVDML